jgi:hypothetical protein
LAAGPDLGHPLDHHLVGRGKARVDNEGCVLDPAEGHGPGLDPVAFADHVHGLAALDVDDGPLGHEQGVCALVHLGPDLGELAGFQESGGIGEHAPDAERAGLGVHGPLGHVGLPGMGIDRVVGQNQGQGIFPLLAAFFGHGLGQGQIVPLADGKIHVHGIGGGDFGQKRVVALADEVADRGQGLADAAGDGGGDPGVAEVALGGFHGGFGAVEIGGQLFLAGQPGVVFVAADGPLLVEGLKARQVDLRLGEQGLLPGQLGLGLLQVLLVLARLDDKEQVALFDQGAFGKKPLPEVALDPGPDLHVLLGRHPADELGRDRHVGHGGPGGLDHDGRGLRRLGRRFFLVLVSRTAAPEQQERQQHGQTGETGLGQGTTMRQGHGRLLHGFMEECLPDTSEGAGPATAKSLQWQPLRRCSGALPRPGRPKPILIGYIGIPAARRQHPVQRLRRNRGGNFD